MGRAEGTGQGQGHGAAAGSAAAVAFSVIFCLFGFPMLITGIALTALGFGSIGIGLLSVAVIMVVGGIILIILICTGVCGKQKTEPGPTTIIVTGQPVQQTYNQPPPTYQGQGHPQGGAPQQYANNGQQGQGYSQGGAPQQYGNNGQQGQGYSQGGAPQQYANNGQQGQGHPQGGAPQQYDNSGQSQNVVLQEYDSTNVPQDNDPAYPPKY